MSLIHNERIKLTAAYLNGLAIAVFAIGTAAPLVSVLLQPTARWPLIMPVALGCFVLSGGLHFTASRALRRIQE